MAKEHLFIDDIIKPKNLGAAISIKAIHEDLRRRFFQRINKYTKVLCITKGDTFIIKALIPSERNGDLVENVFYDVILEFYPVEKEHKTSRTISSYAVNVFSNCPAFTYDFTYVYAKRNCLVSFIPKGMYNKKSLKDAPVVRNPYKLTAIDKTIWFVIEYLKENDLFKKSRLKLIKNEVLNPKTLIESIKGQIEKLEEVQSIEKKTRLKKEVEKLKSKERTKKSTSKSSKKTTTKSNLKSNSLKKPLLKTEKTTSKLSNSDKLKKVVKNKLKTKR